MKFILYCSSIIICPIFGCATKSIQFNSDVKAQVSLVSLENLQDVGTPVGDTPATVDPSTLEGKAVRLTSEGKAPIYWLSSEAQGYSTQITFKMVPIKASESTSSDTKVDKGVINRTLRLIMKAYQALVSKEYDVAKSLATQASAIDPSLAAPFIVSGLASLESGKNDDARNALNTAKALDPEDAEIDVLLKELR